MTSKELNRMLLHSVPEITPFFLEEVSWQDGEETGSHIVFSDILVPYLSHLVRESNTSALQSIFHLIESLLCAKDPYADEVITLSFLDSLSEDPSLLQYCRQFFGEKTKAALESST